MRVIDIQEQWQSARAQPWQEVFIARMDHYECKVIQALGEYPWHQHDERDDGFLVLDGCLIVEWEGGSASVRAGQMLVVPRGVRHRTWSESGARVLLFEPMTGE